MILQTNISYNTFLWENVVHTRICCSAMEALKFDEPCCWVADTSWRKRTLGFQWPVLVNCPTSFGYYSIKYEQQMNRDKKKFLPAVLSILSAWDDYRRQGSVMSIESTIKIFKKLQPKVCRNKHTGGFDSKDWRKFLLSSKSLEISVSFSSIILSARSRNELCSSYRLHSKVRTWG